MIQICIVEENRLARSTCFAHKNVQKQTWISRDGRIYYIITELYNLGSSTRSKYNIKKIEIKYFLLNTIYIIVYIYVNSVCLRNMYCKIPKT